MTPASRIGLIAPPLDGPPTGGTLYNRNLTAALRRAGATVDARTIERALVDARADLTLVDSLYLAELPDLQERVPAVALLLHYLPSQVRLGRAVRQHELTAAERSALAVAAGVIVTSDFMTEQLQVLEVPTGRILCIEPGTLTITRTPDRGSRLRALMLANVVEGKGLLPFLNALALQLQAGDALALDVVGSLDAEPSYAGACRELIAAQPVLREHVQLLGALAHERALAELARADVLVSASRVESYGMALAEARAAGVPILALSGGNASAHVEESAGGQLCSDSLKLARALLELARDRALFSERDRLARAAIRTRSWDSAAAELLAALAQRVITAS